ncbi:effector-associated constant component EACC1 [Nocardia nova]|uniref:effector-associated constant component EACC1 n=1 Tax=Nocardia nova TaxID=37330 RepID=UPI0033F43620
MRRSRSAPTLERVSGSFDVLVVAVGAAGTATVLSSSLRAWLSYRRSATTMQIAQGDRIIELDSTNLRDALQIAELLTKRSGDSEIDAGAERVAPERAE